MSAVKVWRVFQPGSITGCPVCDAHLADSALLVSELPEMSPQWIASWLRKWHDGGHEGAP